MIRIAVDAMGGDFAPKAIVEGALSCLTDARCDFGIVLLGDRARIEPLIPSATDSARISVRHTTEVIEMHESPTAALKTKKDSSILRGLELHRSGEVQAFMSAGNTGAVMAASTLVLGRIEGVARPTIGTFIPRPGGWTLLVDAGANVDSKPLHLLQFGIMGSIFSAQMLGIASPRVGLLNVGEEEGKGNEASVEAHRLLQTAPVNFVGNIEGRDILAGAVDVAVCDGFVGNIVLKFAESVPGFLKKSLRQYAETGLMRKLSVGFMAGTLRKIFKQWDYQDHGGVPLLGVNGVSIIGHGSSSPKAIKNMIFKAKEILDRGVNERIAQTLQSLAVRVQPA